MATEFKQRRRRLLTLCLVLTTLLSCTKKEKIENILYIPVDANIKAIDPLFASDNYVARVVGQINEGLLSYHYLKRPLELIPLLAETLPQISRDGLTYTFKIKKGVKFQDDPSFPEGTGRELVAQDFIFSWKRIADPSLKSESFWLVDKKIQGLNEWREKRLESKVTFDAPIEGLLAPDAHTLVIKLTKPCYQFLHILAMASMAVVPFEAVNKYGAEYLNHPVGTGPFKLKNWIYGNQIVLEKNLNFRGDHYPSEGEPSDREKGRLNDAGKSIPFVDGIVIQELLEDQPMWFNFMKGNLDASPIPKDNFETVFDRTSKMLKKEITEKEIDLVVDSVPDVRYTCFNTEDKILKNQFLRLALSVAYNREAFIEKFYNGRALTAQGAIPPDVDGYDPTFKNIYSEYNLNLAKELLKKAGYPEGKGLAPLILETTNQTLSRQMAEFFQNQMAAIGVTIKIQIETWAEMTSRIKKRQAQMWQIAWTADYPDAENFLQLFYGPNLSPGSNAANYKSPEFDKLYKSASLLPPGPARTKLYQQMQTLVAKDAPWIFELHRIKYRTYHPWLYNYKPNEAISNAPKYYRIDGAKRAQLKARL